MSGYGEVVQGRATQGELSRLPELRVQVWENGETRNLEVQDWLLERKILHRKFWRFTEVYLSSIHLTNF